MGFAIGTPIGSVFVCPMARFGICYRKCYGNIAIGFAIGFAIGIAMGFAIGFAMGLYNRNAYSVCF